MAPSASGATATTAEAPVHGGPRVTLAAAMFFTQRRDGDALEVELAGRWRAAELSAIDAEIDAIPLSGLRELRVTVPEGLEMDLAGAWQLRDWLETAANNGIDVQ